MSGLGDVVVPGSAHRSLAAAIATELDAELATVEVERFPDGEQLVRIESTVAGRSVCIVQPCGPPVDQHLIELLMLIDASRRAGAASIAAVVPYVAYARQDRRRPGESLGSRLVGDLLGAVHVERVIVVDPHTPALEAILGVSTSTVTAVPALADAIAAAVPEQAVLVAPDLGAAKLVECYAEHLGWPTAVVHKRRISAETVEARQLIGDVRGQAAVIVDDMISTGGTIEAAARRLLEEGASRVVVAATHGLFVGPARDRLAALPVERVIVSESLPQRADLPFALDVVSLAPLLAGALRNGA